jgi:hypothetical protein
MEESAGRSGSLFYRTEDKKFFFKTILHPEVGTLVAALKDYVQVSNCIFAFLFLFRALWIHSGLVQTLFSVSFPSYARDCASKLIIVIFFRVAAP